MRDTDLLDQKLILKRGRLRRVERWWRGSHPCKGVITRGLTGWETIERKDCITPVGTFVVVTEAKC